MQESSVYQHLVETAGEERYRQGVEQGIEQGARQTTIESTVAILTQRFPHAEVNALTPILEAIDDLKRLKQVNLNASIAQTFEVFRERLET